jgi:hypothetical protein
MGYAPVYWWDQNCTFGTEVQLRSMINTYKQKGVGVIADVVINHRGSVGVNGSWVDFPAETYNGVTYQMGLADICKNDDGGNTAKNYPVTGANDTGEDWGGMRDLDHTSKNVQDNVIAYLKAMVLYVANGEKWDKTIENFIRWSLQYDLWCKMHFFGQEIEMAESAMNSEKRSGPQNLLELLPDVFTREELQKMRQKMGVDKGHISKMINNWKVRGYIELHGKEMPSSEIIRQQYAKTERYLNKR